MSLLDPIPRSELGTKYTHKGWFCGLVPVYLGEPESDEPLIAERNGVPEWWFYAVVNAFQIFITVGMQIHPEWDPPGFPVVITGKIEP